jgi:hypothetical protein
MIGFFRAYLQLQSIMTAHNQWRPKTHSIPYWATRVFSSTETDLVLIYESVTYESLKMHELNWTVAQRWIISYLFNIIFEDSIALFYIQ